MADRSDQTPTPMTRAEADRYERPIRRQMYIGLLAGVAVLIVLIVIAMEARYRAALGQAQPSALFDRGLQQVVDAYVPLPEPTLRVRIGTNRDVDPPRYELDLVDDNGDSLYRFSRPADQVYLIGYGARAGGPINYEAELALDYDGTVSGQYRQDRGVSVSRYQEVLQGLVREALAAYTVSAEYPIIADDPERIPDTDALRRDWDAAMD